MNFDLTKQQVLIRDTVKEFAQREVAPMADELDRSERFPLEIIEKLGKLGMMGIMIPTEYGGAGLDAISYALIIEELSKADSTTGALVSVHNSFAPYILFKWGNEDQRRNYIPPLAKGERYGAFAATEPNAGSDLGAMQTTAVLEGDSYIINGTKTFISGGPRARTIIVFALTDREAGARGMSAFIVENTYKGFRVGSVFDKMGIKASETSELIFEDMAVPRENLIGKPGEGFKIALSSIDGGRIGIASQAVGIAQRALDKAIARSKERVQFGKPISNLQAIQWMIAEMATRIEASRLLTRRAAFLKDTGAKFSMEAAMAKLMASETAVFCADRSLQIHGGYGYMREYGIERLYRDAKITEIYEGTSEVQKLVISSSILR
ncbi:MAG: acyl-CoA dehydrogenase family protein [Candidatus Thermoplasmatota archaeon]|nr:acyl-CoA dehydrogenase family protein [Candidatus Thermoplasmatota archaeon]